MEPKDSTVGIKTVHPSEGGAAPPVPVPVQESTVSVPAESSRSAAEQHCDLFIDAMKQLRDSITTLWKIFPLFPSALSELKSRSTDNLKKYAEQNGTVVENAANHTFRAEVPISKIAKFRKLANELDRYSTAASLFPKTMLVMLVSQFDDFIGQLVRGLFTIKPQVLNASEKNIAFADLVTFGSVEVARDFIVEKEVEGVLRSSHSEQFKWLESRLGIPLTKDLPAWSKFIEVTERRNLFAHTDGSISGQYLKVCESCGALNGNGPKRGEKLGCSPEYFFSACQAVLEVGLKLAYVMWRKLLPDFRAKADLRYNDHCVQIIELSEYRLAIELLKFAFEIPKPPESTPKLFMTVNLAQAHKWNGDKDAMGAILADIDWANLAPHYQLAEAVLRDDLNRAAKLMKLLGISEDVTEQGYIEWPLFREFRKSAVFAQTFKEVFGHEFELQTVVEQPKPQGDTTQVPDEPAEGPVQHEVPSSNEDWHGTV
jgi:hypothetical protein